MKAALLKGLSKKLQHFTYNSSLYSTQTFLHRNLLFVIFNSNVSDKSQKKTGQAKHLKSTCPMGKKILVAPLFKNINCLKGTHQQNAF